MEAIRYLAIGDSYTIGTGLEEGSANFPSQLARTLRESTGLPVDIRNLGVNGYTTADLIREELPIARTSKPELVTVLIGANDIVQGIDEKTYRLRLVEIYDTIRHVIRTAECVAAVSTPDFSALPGAAPFGTPSRLRQRIDSFNDIAKTEAAGHGFQFVDITPISRAAGKSRDWIAEDNLHPGPAQHQAFAEKIWETAGTRWSRVRDRPA